jgi:hypothetical protein
MLGFMYLRPRFWLEVLIDCVLSVEVFTMFRQNWVVATLWCIFSLLSWLSGQIFIQIFISTQDTDSTPVREKILATEAITVD